jgi:hypothetical protein
MAGPSLDLWTADAGALEALVTSPWPHDEDAVNTRGTAGPLDLPALCAAFAMTPAAATCSTPDGAYANCYAVSVRFARFLREHHVACLLLVLTGPVADMTAAAGRWPYLNPSTASHWVVQVGDVIIDWTARQFDPAAELPYLSPAATAGERWGVVEHWACESCAMLVADERHVELTATGLELAHRLVAERTGGAGPFSDRRHDQTRPLERVCAHVCGEQALTAAGPDPDLGHRPPPPTHKARKCWPFEVSGRHAFEPAMT